MSELSTLNNQVATLDFYLSAIHGAGRGSFLVYLSLVGMWASEGERSVENKEAGRKTSLSTMKKFKRLGAKYTGLTVDSFMTELPGLNTLSQEIPVIRLVRDPVGVITSALNLRRLSFFYDEKFYQRAACTMTKAKTACEDFFKSDISNISYESIFKSLKCPSEVRVVDTSEIMPETVLQTIRRVTAGFELADHNPNDRRFFQSYGTGINVIFDNMNTLLLSTAQGTQTVLKIWPDYLAYRLVLWRDIPARFLAEFEIDGQNYRVVQLPEKAGDDDFVFDPDRHMQALEKYTKNMLEQLQEIEEKFKPHELDKQAIVSAIRKTPKLYEKFMSFWDKEWSPLEEASPGHIQAWWKNSLEIVSGALEKRKH